jgi:hypothetical protein
MRKISEKVQEGLPTSSDFKERLSVKMREERSAAASAARKTGGVIGVIYPLNPIPKKINEVTPASWALFLICNPAWYLPKNHEKVLDLYQQFVAFGRAIGSQNVAIWFWKDLPRGTIEPFWYKDGPSTWVTFAVDETRNSRYCQQYELLPSQSPHVLVTTHYPVLSNDEQIEKTAVLHTKEEQNPVSPEKPKHYAALKLHGADPTEITSLLAKLADQVLVEGLNQHVIDSEQYWQSWIRIVRQAAQSVSGLVDKVTLTLNTTLFKTEIKGKDTKP